MIWTDRRGNTYTNDESYTIGYDFAKLFLLNPEARKYKLFPHIGSEIKKYRSIYYIDKPTLNQNN